MGCARTVPPHHARERAGGIPEVWRRACVAVNAIPISGAEMTIGRGIRCSAARVPDRVAISAGGQLLTYRELVRRIARIAHVGLGHLRLKPGDRVALVADNILEYVEYCRRPFGYRRDRRHAQPGV